MGKLDGKVALVTGAAGGIGKAIAELFEQEGAVLIGADISEKAGVRLDIASEEQWERVMGEILEKHGRLDVVVNNAAIFNNAPIEEVTLEQWRRVMSVNLDGTFLGTKHAIRAIRKAGNGGAIVNMSSASGLRAATRSSAYCTSKAGITMLSKAAALDCAAAGDNIRVNSIAPAAVRTAAWEGAQWWASYEKLRGGKEEAWRGVGEIVPLGRVATVAEVAKAVLFLSCEDSSYMTGTELIVDGGYTVWGRDAKFPIS